MAPGLMDGGAVINNEIIAVIGSRKGRIMGKRSVYDQPDNFINRELSWLAFNRRVLEEAGRDRNPLLDQLRFLAITASNLDEFIMVRIAALRDQMEVGYPGRDLSGLTPAGQLEMIDREIRDFRQCQYRIWSEELLPRLAGEGIRMIPYGTLAHPADPDLSPSDRDYLDHYFMNQVFPVLTPMAIDSSRPFPLLHSGRTYIGALVRTRGKAKDHTGDKKSPDKNSPDKKKKKKKYDVAVVPVPALLSRLVRLPADEEKQETRLVLLESLIESVLDRLFMNHEILCSAPFRVMRSAELSIAEQEAPDLLLEIEKQLMNRERGEVILMEHDARMDPRLLKYLKKKLGIRNRQIYPVPGPPDLSFTSDLASLKGCKRLRRPPYNPSVTPGFEAGQDLFSRIRKRDILLHHPYESFDPVEDLIRQAAEDDKVLAIKQTLYRVSGRSRLIRHLEKAAKNGKQVLVMVELKARFDEERNINWARRLEKAGVHVIYGLVGLKIHCKLTMIVRMESEGIRSYVHLATGNYNDITARQYTDLALLTCDPAMGEDATALFNMLSGYSRPAVWKKLITSPDRMKNQLLKMINREIRHSQAGEPAGITVKCNALCDKDIILALYEASSAGVPIDLIVRGICCLIPGRPGISENIRVRSLVGRFLEHARIYHFVNGGKEKILLGSADLMPRNLERRVEILFPIEKKVLRQRIRHILDLELADTENARILLPDGSWQAAGDHDIDLRTDATVAGKEESIEESFDDFRRRDGGDAQQALIEEAMQAVHPELFASMTRPDRDEVN